MKQSLLASWIETIASTATGFVISLALQYLICWWFDLPLRVQDNLAIIALFTVASLLRGLAWRRLMEKLHVRRPLSPFMQAVIAERFRQIEIEGYDKQHDAGHSPRELAHAGAAYFVGWNGGGSLWPWLEGFKPDAKDTRRDLVRGCALGIAAGDLNEILSRKRKPLVTVSAPTASTKVA